MNVWVTGCSVGARRGHEPHFQWRIALDHHLVAAVDIPAGFDVLAHGPVEMIGDQRCPVRPAGPLVVLAADRALADDAPAAAPS